MTKKVNTNVKSGLAKLMATENITVIFNPKLKTAGFDIKKRICYLPMLKDMEDEFVYNAFIAHEVGHALYTPYSEKEYDKLMGEIPMVFLNVTEDARIEKMIKEEYPGVVRSFYQFYKKTVTPEVDFFKLQNRVKPFTLLDRINLRFKVGFFIKVDFTPEEMKFVEMVDKEVTFEDAIAAAKAIYEYMKKQGEEQQTEPSEAEDGEGEEAEQESFGSGGEAMPTTKRKQNKSKDIQEKKDAEAKKKEAAGIPVDTGCTQSDFNEAMEQQYIANGSDSDNSYFGDILRFDLSWKKYVLNLQIPSNIDLTSYKGFIKSITPTVNMMASHFNMKKTASDYYKNSVQKTGQLCPDHLVHYRTSEDIFLHNEIVFDSKNHGMVMIIDWSSSMSGDIGCTVKQLLVLTEFCRKTQIPFEVYGFTSAGEGIGPVGSSNVSADMKIDVFKIISSDMSPVKYTQHAAYLYNNSCSEIGGYTTPDTIHSMGGTPINSMATLTEYIVKEFKQKFKREKTIMCFLSDGDETDKMKEGLNGHQIYKQRTGHIVMRDSLTGKSYDHNFREDGPVWHTIFKYVKEKCDITKLVGFYLGSEISNHTIELVAPNQQKKLRAKDLDTKLSIDKYVEFSKDRAFDKYFVVSIANFDVNMGERKLEVKPFDTEKKLDEKLDAFFAHNTKPLLFLKKFIQEIA